MSQMIISGIDAKYRRDAIIRGYERSVMLKFIHDAVAPVTQFGKNGFLAQIGKGTNAEIKFLKVHVVNIGGDGEFQDGLGGCNCQRQIANCRMCKDRATSRIVIFGKESIRYRDDNEHELVVKRAGQLENLRIRAAAEGRRLVLDAAQQAVLDRLETLSLTGGRNPLYRLFYYFNAKNITSFHRSLHPDRLHVILKGIVEKTIAWSMSIVHNLGIIDKTYKDSMKTLDKRVSTFPDFQTYAFFRCIDSLSLNKNIDSFH